MITPLQPTALPAELSSDVETRLQSILKNSFFTLQPLINYYQIFIFLLIKIPKKIFSNVTIQMFIKIYWITINKKKKLEMLIFFFHVLIFKLLIVINVNDETALDVDVLHDFVYILRLLILIPKKKNFFFKKNNKFTLFLLCNIK